MSSSTSPSPSPTRILSLDVMRGFAMLGIFLMNGVGFSMPLSAYFNPYSYGGSDPLNLAVHALLHTLADQKFMAMFSLLFGASMLLILDARKRKGLPQTRFHYLRNFWLLVIGSLHMVFVWSGDILAVYACCGFVLFFFRRLPATWMFGLGLCIFLTPLVWQLGFATQTIADTRGLSNFWTPQGPALERVFSVYKGPYSMQFAERIGEYGRNPPPYSPLIFLYSIGDLPSRALGMMLIGMGMYRQGVFQSKTCPQLRQIFAAITLGVSLCAVGAALNYAHGWDPAFALGPGRSLNLIATPILALSYIFLIKHWCQHERGLWLRDRLAAVGRMALTNYLFQSTVATSVFYGFGLSLFGQVSRIELLGMTLILWLVQLQMSHWWMRRFAYGPVEWLWRALTQFKLPPMRRAST